MENKRIHVKEKKEEKSFLFSLTGKIMMAVVAGIIALGAAWLVSRFAFSKMLETVEELSEPNKKLQLVNSLFHDFAHLNRYIRMEELPPSAEESLELISETERIRMSLDSLYVLCSDNEVQITLIDSVRQLLWDREEILISYLNVRQSLMNNEFVEEELELLEQLIDRHKADSLVLTTDHKVVTTIVKPRDTILIEREKESAIKEFWKSITRKQEELDRAEVVQEERVVEREVISQIDTLVFAQRDSILREAKELLGAISQAKRQTQRSYFSREAELTAIERTFFTQVLSILSAVEQEVLRQTEANTQSVQDIVSKSIDDLWYIAVAFIFIITLLLILILTDIVKSNSYRKQLVVAKNEAEFHSKSRERFLSNMSHEIRTPLQSIIGFSEQMKFTNEKSEKEDVDAIHGAANHLMQIVNEVLDYNRITSGNFTIEEAPFNPRNLVREVIQNMLPQSDKKSIELRLNDELTGDYNCIGDAFRLRQILYNLLGNAIKFTDRGQVILTVSNDIQQEKAVLTFSVKDTGLGIPADKLTAIFNQFEQADVEVAKRFGGSGLGLSIVKSLVDQQNGKLDVESEPGKGSCFTVSIPYKKGQFEDVEKELNHTDIQSFSGVVWLVDDDPFIVRLFDRILTKYQIEHRVFHSAEELLAAQWDDRIEYVLMDIRMRGMNGDQLCRILRDEHGTRYRFVAVTAQALPEERERIMSCGFDDILLKPFTEDKLLKYFKVESDFKQVDEIPVFYNGEELFKSMFAMTMGDKKMARDIVETFVSESRRDIQLLSELSVKEQSEETALILHRLAGRIGQAGAHEMAQTLRDMELEVRNQITNSEWQRKIEDVVESVLDLVAEVEDSKMMT